MRTHWPKFPRPAVPDAGVAAESGTLELAWPQTPPCRMQLRPRVRGAGLEHPPRAAWGNLEATSTAVSNWGQL